MKEAIKKMGVYLLLLMISPIIFMVALATLGNAKRQRHYLVFLLSPSIWVISFAVYLLITEYPFYRSDILIGIWFFSIFVFLFGSMPASITAALSGLIKMICKHYWQWILITTLIGAVISSILGLLVETSGSFWQFGLMGGVCALVSSCILWWFDKYRS